MNKPIKVFTPKIEIKKKTNKQIDGFESSYGIKRKKTEINGCLRSFGKRFKSRIVVK